MDTIDTNLDKLKSLAASRQKQIKRQNEWNKEHYKRISIAIPFELYNSIISKHGNISMNGYLTRLIRQDLDIQDT